MKINKKIIALVLSFAILISSLVFSATATEDFTMNDTLDKGYITFVFDDGNMPFTQDLADLFEEFGMPMCAATIANKVEEGNDLYNALVQIQDNGGEILSHGYAHKAITSSTATTVGIYEEADIEAELGNSWRKLTNLGFNVNGIIQVGNGGDEGTADYDLVESIARKYYKYSNGSGTSMQYDITQLPIVAEVNRLYGRRFMNRDTLAQIKNRINQAATNKDWLILSAHNYGEITNDSASTDVSTMREILQYIKDKNGAVEVVTWNDMYETYGVYNGESVPSEEALESLEKRDFYVGYGGTGDGSSLEKMAPSVAKAVDTINANGLKTGDTATIHIVQDIANFEETSENTSGMGLHNLAYWGSVPTHTAKIIIKPYETNQTQNTEITSTYLVTNKNVGYDLQMKISGPTVFEDLVILYAYGTNVASVNNRNVININGCDVTFGEGVTYAYIPCSSANGYAWDGTITSYNPINMAYGISTAEYPNSVKVKYENALNYNGSRFYFPSYPSGTYTYKKDFTFEFTGSTNLTGINFGREADTITTIDGNFNFKFGYLGDSSESFRFFNGSSNVTVNGGVQVIDSGISYSTNGATVAEWSDITALVDADGNPAKTWYLNVEDSAVNNIDFIEGETGKFSVAEGMGAIATPADGGEEIYSENGILDLSAAPGEYNVSVAVKTYDYYVQSGGTGDGMSEASPAPSVKAALTSMVNSGGLAPSDTANIWIMQDIASTQNTGLSGTNRAKHNMAFWGGTVAHSNKIIIKPHANNQTVNTGLTTTYLAIGELVAAQSVMKLGGPTEFQNLKIVYDSSSNLSNSKEIIIANGHNLTMGNGVSYGYVNANGNTVSSWTGAITDIAHLPTSVAAAGGGTYTKPININFNNAITYHANCIEVPALVTGTYTFDEDVTLGFSNSDSYGVYIRVGTKVTTSTVNFNKNLNFKFANNGTYRFSNGSSNVVVKGGVQLITSNNTHFNWSDGKDYSINSITKFVDENGAAADKWHLYVPNDKIGYIDFIEGETGKFSLSGTAIATATHKTSGNLKESEDGVLDLSGETGEYDITIEIPRPKVYDYYVKVGGTGDGTSVEAAAPTVSAAIATINELRLNANETANIYLIQEATTITADGSKNHNLITWGSFIEHDAKIVLKGYSENVYNDNLKYPILAASKLLGNDGNIKFGGPTVIDDVCIMQTYGISNTTVKVVLNFNAQDVTITENARFAYFNGRSDAYSSADAWANADFFADGKIIYVGAVQSYITNGDTKLEITKPVNVTINKGFSTTEWGGSFYVIGDSTDTFKEDVTVNLNLATSSNPRVYIGKSYGATFEKNLNVKLTKGNNFGFNPDYAITVNGGIQFIYSDAVSFNSGRPYNNIDNNAKDADGNAAKSWIIKVADSDIDTVNFTSETGKFTAVKEGLAALATRTDIEGAEPIAANADGVLDLSAAPGEYEITYVDEYTNDLSTIRVYKDVELDLSQVKHIDYDGKLFIGWKYSDTDQYPQTENGVATLNAGDILVADFIDFKAEEFTLEDVELRYDDSTNGTAIRYVISKNKASMEKIGATDSEYGAIWLPADTTQGFEIFLDKKQVQSWCAYPDILENGNDEWDVHTEVGAIPNQVIADSNKILAETETDIKYSVCLKGIPEAKNTTFYALRGYVKFTDKNGVPSAVYTEQSVSSLYKEACDTDDTLLEKRTDVHSSIITASETKLAADRASVEASYKTPWEQYGDTQKMTVDGVNYGVDNEQWLIDNDYMVYRTSQYGVVYTRPITVDTGMDVEDDEMLFITDTHVTYINEKDINERYENAFGYYKQRAFYNKPTGGPSRANFAGVSVNLANFASLYDKVVLGGDMADFVSDGNYQAIKRIWADRSINNGKSLKGSVSMTTGNHEFSQSKATAEETLTTEQMHANLDKVMFSGKKLTVGDLPEGNSYIDYDIMYKADGTTPNYMIITMDNASGNNWGYHNEQVAPLQAYINYAKQNNIPIILFQHVPMATGNEAEKSVWYVGDLGKYVIGGTTKPESPIVEISKWSETNMYNGEGFTGYTVINGTEPEGSATDLIYKMITNNADTIKAVFCGHNHGNYNTEIIAKNSDGTDATIPQYTTINGYNNGVTEINIK